MSNPTWRTRANLLTLIRLIAILPLGYAIVEQAWVLAASLFVVAVVSDIFDGKVARRYGETSAFGGLFDHSTDAAFVTVGLWALAQQDLVPIWLVFLVPAAFVQYMLDSKALAGLALRTSLIGRSNGVAYFVLVGTAIGAMGLNWSWLLDPVRWLAWILIATTVISMGDRLATLISTQRS